MVSYEAGGWLSADKGTGPAAFETAVHDIQIAEISIDLCVRIAWYYSIVAKSQP